MELHWTSQMSYPHKQNAISLETVEKRLLIPSHFCAGSKRNDMLLERHEVIDMKL